MSAGASAKAPATELLELPPRRRCRGNPGSASTVQLQLQWQSATAFAQSRLGGNCNVATTQAQWQRRLGGHKRSTATQGRRQHRQRHRTGGTNTKRKGCSLRSVHSPILPPNRNGSAAMQAHQQRRLGSKTGTLSTLTLGQKAHRQRILRQRVSATPVGRPAAAPRRRRALNLRGCEASSWSATATVSGPLRTSLARNPLAWLSRALTSAEPSGVALSGPH